MSRIIDLLVPALPADVWLELANQLEQQSAAKTYLERDYHANKVCAILNGGVQL